MRAWIAVAIALAAAALPAAYSQIHTPTYEGDSFSFKYPGSWITHDKSPVDWDAWRVHVWVFGPEGNGFDSRMYVAEIPPVIADGEEWDDATYVARIAVSEANFCSSGEIEWEYFVCRGFDIVHASYDTEGSRYLVIGEWVREYDDGREVRTTSARLDIPTESDTFVLYAEAPTEKWDRLGMEEMVRTFSHTASR